jgi:hypothetical protein
MSILFRDEKADETILEEGFVIDPGVCEHCNCTGKKEEGG